MSNAYQTPQADLTPQKGKKSDNPITQDMIDGLANGRKWAMFLAVLGYIQLGFIGLMIAVMLFALFQVGFAAIFGIAFYGIIAFIVFKITRLVHQYSAAVREFEDRETQGYLFEAQEYYTSFIKWVGYIFVFFIVIMLIAFLFSLVFG